MGGTHCSRARPCSVAESEAAKCVRFPRFPGTRPAIRNGPSGERLAGLHGPVGGCKLDRMEEPPRGPSRFRIQAGVSGISPRSRIFTQPEAVFRPMIVVSILAKK